MRQENSFFFQPLIYFGSCEQWEEEEEEETWNFSNLSPTFRQRIGLFIQWSENF